MLILGPVPSTGEDEVFHNSLTKQETFRIKAEKVPNAKGIKRVMDMLGGPQSDFVGMIASASMELKKLKGGWIVGGYLSPWLPKETPALFKRGYKVVQDILPTALSQTADILLPAAAWAEKDGCWENYAGKIQPFAAAIRSPEGTRREGDVYLPLLGRTGMYSGEKIRTEMGEPFASIKLPDKQTEAPAFEFAEL